MSRYARNVDSTHRPVVEAMRAAGASVEAIQGARAGVPDLVVGVAGLTELVEVKRPRAKPSEAQEAWHRAWRGRPVRVVRSTEEALAVVAAMRADAARQGRASDVEVDASDYERAHD